jgi:hypothetical protein
MTSARDILGTVTLEPKFDIEALATVLQALSDLNRDATACSSAMIASDHGSMATEIRAALDCADTAGTAERVLARGAAADLGVTTAVLEAAVVSAERSAELCGKHTDHHAHCRLHSDTARRVSELGRAELARLGS